MKELTIVEFCYGGDGNTALYENNDLVISGDYSHDKINSLIKGYILCLKRLAWETQEIRLYPTNDHKLVEDGWCHEVPKTLTTLREGGFLLTAEEKEKEEDG